MSILAQEPLTEATEPRTAIPTAEADDVADGPGDTIESLLEKIQGDSYGARDTAYELLLLRPEEAIQPIEAALPLMDHDAASRLIRLLGTWGTRPDEGLGIQAWEVLQRLSSGGVTSNSQLARYISMTIWLNQSKIAEDRLKKLSAFIGEERIQVVTSAKEGNCLRIDEKFRGTADDLLAARWLIDPTIVRLEGERIDRSWLEKIVPMPNVKIVQLKHTSLTADDIQLLRQMKYLDTLEILYMPIDDMAIESLGSLPIWGSLRVFGTKITPESVPRLESLLEGTQVVFGLGGFLGIQSSNLTLEVSEVNPGSGADKGGMLAQDRILSINGKPLQNFEELRKELGKSPAGAEVSIVVRRYEGPTRYDGVPRTPIDLTLTITLGEQ